MLSRLIAAVLVSVSAFSVEATASREHPADAATETTVPVDDSTAETTVPVDDSSTETTVNPLLPERENVSDCFGGVPRPNCGSKARGGWRQGAVFGAVVVAMAAIGARLVVGVRRRDRRAG